MHFRHKNKKCQQHDRLWRLDPKTASALCIRTFSDRNMSHSFILYFRPNQVIWSTIISFFFLLFLYLEKYTEKEKHKSLFHCLFFPFFKISKSKDEWGGDHEWVCEIYIPGCWERMGQHKPKQWLKTKTISPHHRCNYMNLDVTGFTYSVHLLQIE